MEFLFENPKIFGVKFEENFVDFFSNMNKSIKNGKKVQNFIFKKLARLIRKFQIERNLRGVQSNACDSVRVGLNLQCDYKLERKSLEQTRQLLTVFFQRDHPEKGWSKHRTALKTVLLLLAQNLFMAIFHVPPHQTLAFSSKATRITVVIHHNFQKFLVILRHLTHKINRRVMKYNGGDNS